MSFPYLKWISKFLSWKTISWHSSKHLQYDMTSFLSTLSFHLTRWNKKPLTEWSLGFHAQAWNKKAIAISMMHPLACSLPLLYNIISSFIYPYKYIYLKLCVGTHTHMKNRETENFPKGTSLFYRMYSDLLPINSLIRNQSLYFQK